MKNHYSYRKGKQIAHHRAAVRPAGIHGGGYLIGEKNYAHYHAGQRYNSYAQPQQRMFYIFL